MDAVKIALFDVLKYSVVVRVNTGDKTMDNLCIAFLLAVIASFSVVKIMFWIYTILYQVRKICKRKKDLEITLQNYQYYQQLINSYDKKLFYTYTWEWASGDFVKQLYLYIVNKSLRRGMKLVDNNFTIVPSFTTKDYTNVLNDILKVDKENTLEPLYVCSNGILGYGATIYGTALFSTNTETLNQFLSILQLQSSADKDKNELYKKSTKLKRIFINQRTYDLYRDRNFDLFISCWKPQIMALLENFTKMNSEENMSWKQKFGTFNLGFILHGEPGTGKTSFVKCLCNYLQRDAQVINMRDIKTKTEFENLFTIDSIRDNVFVFEEFDCVQGVFDRKEFSHKEEIDKLETNYRKLLATTNKSDHISNKLEKEMENIKEKISKLENALTIDTVLTVLDGMAEHRNRVIVATTNHIDKIDPALVREGRFDLKIKLEKFNNEETRELLSKYFADEKLDYLQDKEFPKQYTPVQLINICRQYKNLRDVVDFLLYKID